MTQGDEQRNHEPVIGNEPQNNALERGGHRNLIFSSLIWKTIERGGNQLLLIVVQLVMARLLAPEVFGALAIILVFSLLGTILVQSGLNFSLIQSREVEDDDYSTVFWMSLATATVIYAAIFFAAPFIADFYHMPALTWPLRGMSVVLFFSAYASVPIAQLTREFRFKALSLSTLLGVFLSGAFGVASALLGFGLWALVIQQLTYQIAWNFMLARAVRWHPRFRFSTTLARKHYRFGWKLLVSGLVSSVYESSYDLIIGKKFSLSQLGMVSQGKRYGTAIGTILNGVIQPIMLAAVSRAQEDPEYVKRMVRRALSSSTFVVVPTMTMFVIIAEPLFRVMLGEKWVPAVPFFQIYCLINIFLPIQSVNLQALNGMGRSDLFLRFEVIKRVIGLATLACTAFFLNSALVIVLGYLAVEMIASAINSYPSRKILNYRYGEQFLDILPSFLLAAVAAGCAWALSFTGLPSLLLIVAQALTVGTVYLLLAWLFRVEAFAYLRLTMIGFVRERAAR